MLDNKEPIVLPFGEPAENQTRSQIAKWFWTADQLGFDPGSDYATALNVARRNLVEEYRDVPRVCNHVRMIAFEMLHNRGQSESLHFDHAYKSLLMSHLEELRFRLLAGETLDWKHLA